MDIFIGGGGDDLAFLGLGVLASYARRFAAETGRPVIYLPNARPGRVRRAIAEAAARGEPLSLVGHSWGGPDAWRAAAGAARRGLPVRALVTLDPVDGPLRRRFAGSLTCEWLNVVASPSAPDRSDALTRAPLLARKPSSLPVAQATRAVTLDLNHWDVAGMMHASGARRLIEAVAREA
jgi:pimeloyl-ACP methyl ester carboxylesterase